jgi:hypothetical protein
MRCRVGGERRVGGVTVAGLAFANLSPECLSPWERIGQQGPHRVDRAAALASCRLPSTVRIKDVTAYRFPMAARPAGVPVIAFAQSLAIGVMPGMPPPPVGLIGGRLLTAHLLRTRSRKVRLGARNWTTGDRPQDRRAALQPHRSPTLRWVRSAHSPRRPGPPSAAMRLRVSDPAMLPDLLEFLDRRGAVVEQINDHEVDASLVGSYGSLDTMRMQLYLLIRAWEAGRSHLDAAAEIID